MTALPVVAPIVLEVFGVPQPKGSFYAGRNSKTGKAMMLDGRRPPAREAAKSWRQAIEQSARDWQVAHNAALLDEPLLVTLTFRLPKPKSAPKKRVHADRKPDVDKLARAALDGLTGIVIADDARVCELIARKGYAIDAPPGCTITIARLTEC